MYKSVNINFFITFKILSKFQKSSCRKVTQNMVNICLVFFFCFNVHKLDDSFTFLWKNALCYLALFLCHILSFGFSDLNSEFIRREYGFSINSKMYLMSSDHKPVLTLKIPVTNFFRFRYFADFDIKTALLSQNNFE